MRNEHEIDVQDDNISLKKKLQEFTKFSSANSCYIGTKAATPIRWIRIEFFFPTSS